MLLFTFLLLVLYMMGLSKNKPALICFVVSLFLLGLHSLWLNAYYSVPVAGSDTEFYFNEALLKFHGGEGSNLGSYPKYIGFILFNVISIFPFHDYPNLGALFIRLNYLSLFYVLYLSLPKQVLTFRKNKVLIFFSLVALWFSLFNLRDGIIALVITFLTFSIYFRKGYSRLIIVFLCFGVLRYFKPELIPIILLSLIITYAISLVNLNIARGGIILLAIFLGLFSMRYIPIPKLLHGPILKIVVVNEHDLNEYNDTGLDYAQLLKSNQSAALSDMFNRSLKRIPVLFVGYNPMKFTIIDNAYFNNDLNLHYTPVSYIINQIIRYIQYLIVVPVLILLLIRTYRDNSLNKVIYFNLTALFIVFVIYSIKFGDAQPRIIWPFILPIMLGAFTINYSKVEFRNLKILVPLMFCVMIAYFYLLPPL